MKKILFIILLFLCIKVNASENVNVKLQYVPNVYLSYKENGLTMWGQFAYIYADGVLSYCIDIKTPVTKTVYTVDNSIQINNNVKLIAYFGYGYDNSYTTLKDYMATQLLIWKELGTDIVFTTQSQGKGDVINVSSNVNRILDTINGYDKLPYYNNKFDLILGETYKFSDTNKVDIKDFEIIDNSSNIVSKESNYIMQFIANEVGNNSFRVKRTYQNRFDNIALVASESQNIVRIGSIDEIYKDYNYSVKTGIVTIDLFDATSRSKTNTGLTSYEGISFDLYDANNNFIKNVSGGTEGVVIFDNLSYGNYVIKSSTYGSYGEFPLNLEVEINRWAYDYFYRFGFAPRKLNLKLVKKYKLNGVENNDTNITFEIYNSKNEKIEITTNDSGEASTVLNYDNYKIIQKSDSDISKKYEFDINTYDFNKNDIEYVMSDSIINAKIKIELEDDTGIKISNSKVLVNDREYITDENGIIITDYVSNGEYIIDANNELYEKIDKQVINVNDYSNFIYDSKNSYIYSKIILNKKKVILEEIITTYETDDKKENIDNIKIDNKEEIIIDNNYSNEKNDVIKDNSINVLPFLSSNSYFKGVKWVKEYLYYY